MSTLKSVNENLDFASSLYAHVGDLYGPAKGFMLVASPSGPISWPLSAFLAENLRYSSRQITLAEHLLSEVASKTRDSAGSGGASSVILALALMAKYRKLIASGHSFVAVRRASLGIQARFYSYMDNACMLNPSPADVRALALTTHAHRENLADVVVAAAAHAGAYGEISVSRGYALNSHMRAINGTACPFTPHSYIFKDVYGSSFSFDRPITLLCAQRLTLKPMLPLLSRCADEGIPLVVICNTPDRTLLDVVVHNVVKGNLKCVMLSLPLQAEERAEWAEDFCRLAGGVWFDAQRPAPLTYTEDHTGCLKEFIVDGGSARIVCSEFMTEGSPDIVALRRKADTQKDLVLRARINRRVSMLLGVSSEIFSGGHTKIEEEQAYQVLTDMTHVVRAATTGGYVTGAGTTLCNFVDADGSVDTLTRSVLHCLSTPTLLLYKPYRVAHRKGYVFNIITRRFEEDTTTAVLDTARSVRSAVTNAFSIALTLASTFN